MSSESALAGKISNQLTSRTRHARRNMDAEPCEFVNAFCLFDLTVKSSKKHETNDSGALRVVFSCEFPTVG